MNRRGPLMAAAVAVVALALTGAGGSFALAEERPEPGAANPADYPAWLKSDKRDHRFYRRGRYNFDVYDLKPLARDLNGVAVGHAMAYEDLVTGKAAQLETKTFARIDRILKNPPALMPDEAALSPTFGRRYGVLEQVFDWTHVLHAQTVDVLVSKELTESEKDREVERLWAYYSEAPFAITGLPLNMEFLDRQDYSGAFRKRYPKVNGLFWGYHWLQGAMYDLLWRSPQEWQKRQYDIAGERYRKVELYRTDRPFMPMFAEMSPRFAARFPELSNAFDNLHMLHDMVNDILATEGMSPRRQQEEIRRAIWLVSAEAHRGEKANAVPSRHEGGMHDHRSFLGMAGMGMMKGMTPELMWMPEMGWMSMADCHHCSMPLWDGADAWRNSTISAEGWSMRTRCALCARDMSAETKGRAILRIPTENPERLLIVLSDEQGNLTPSLPEAVFLEQESSHAGCETWSRAFTTRAAFDAFIAENPALKNAKPLTCKQWSERQGEKPDTYVKPKGPVENPYGDPAQEVKP